MKLDKLGRQLKRELVANPKKAAVLAILLLVGVYFWGPLISSRFAKKATPVPMLASSATATAISTGTAASTASTGASANWRQIKAWREQDPLAKAAVMDAHWVNPFGSAAPIKVAAAALPPVVDETEVSIAHAGLVLNSVIMGPRGRAAIINGESFHEQQEVPVDGKSGSRLNFRLIHIRRNSVELERNGKVQTLSFAPPDLSKLSRAGTPPAEADAPAPGADNRGQ